MAKINELPTQLELSISMGYIKENDLSGISILLTEIQKDEFHLN